MNSKKRILIYRLGSLGDTLVALPCFNLIRKRYPNHHITLLTNSPIVSKAAAIELILPQGHCFDEVIRYSLETRSPLTIFKIWLKLRLQSYDKAFYLLAGQSEKRSQRDRAFLRSAGIKAIEGLPFGADIKPQKLQGVEQYEFEGARLIRRLGEPPSCLQDPYLWDLHFTERELEDAEKLLPAEFQAQRMIVLSVGTKMQSKDWGEDNWFELVKKMSHEFKDYALVSMGAADESARSEICLEQWDGLTLNLCGKASPRLSMAILQKASIFIGHDSGPMHMAATVKVPCVAIFSARNLPGNWFPYGDQHEVIYHKTDCFGCYLEVCTERQKECIMSVTTDEVIQKVKTVLA